MSLKPVSVNVCVEVDALLQVVLGVVQDAKAGKTPGTVVADAVPALVSALSGLGTLASELADRKDLETTVALKLVQFIDVFAPPVQPL